MSGLAPAGEAPSPIVGSSPIAAGGASAARRRGDRLVGSSRAVQRVLEQISVAGRGRFHVFISAEEGAEKELVARQGEGTPIGLYEAPDEAAEARFVARRVVADTKNRPEGLSAAATHPIQQAWAELDVPQCGYCQSGQIMAAAALLRKKPQPTDKDIDEAMTNICRCGTYQRIRAGIHLAAKKLAAGGSSKKSRA